MPPPPEPRWRRLPEERPQQILQAAIDVFDQKGLTGARLEDIAKQAGVSKGTIYLYFPNKEELFREMVRTTMIDAMNLHEQMPSEGSATEQLVNYMQNVWELASTQAYMTIYRIINGEIHLFPDLADYYFNEVVLRSRGIVERLINRGIEQGEFRKLDVTIAARMLSALVYTNASWCRKKKFFPKMQDMTDDQIRAQVIDFYLHAIKA